jgi:hypothetical protein
MFVNRVGFGRVEYLFPERRSVFLLERFDVRAEQGLVDVRSEFSRVSLLAPADRTRPIRNGRGG